MIKNVLIEGIDRLGKDTLIRGIQDINGYRLVLHYSKPLSLACYSKNGPTQSEKTYQAASFRVMFETLSALPGTVICNRSHIGEFVYPQLYRGYSGEYVFDLEHEFLAKNPPEVALILLIEDFSTSQHFKDDGKSLGPKDQRQREQELFLEAFARSKLHTKRIVSVTDSASGNFRPPAEILGEVLALE